MVVQCSLVGQKRGTEKLSNLTKVQHVMYVGNNLAEHNGDVVKKHLISNQLENMAKHGEQGSYAPSPFF
jgi:hypothetical protein